KAVHCVVNDAPFTTRIFFRAAIFRSIALYEITLTLWLNLNERSTHVSSTVFHVFLAFALVETAFDLLLTRRKTAAYWYGLVTSGLWLATNLWQVFELH